MKHTKGKWKSTFDSKKKRAIYAKGKGFICFLVKPNHYQNQDKRYEEELEEYKANAKLIAAAPEMLEVCKKVMQSEIDGSYIVASNWWKKMETVIKKATE